ncbi:YdeI/OmpD-associated family protein [Pontibacter sp. 13R65]|uniref:YdeI/OmpD-associated family protein n=1 Tax=Pontibacter sp. 13R65 TaxID=3127458 RepID=UPI00301E0D23
MIQELGKKLQLKQAQQVVVPQAPAAFTDALSAEGFTVATTFEALQEKAAAVQLFVEEKAALEKLVPEAVAALQPEGILWIAYPKKTSGIKTDLTRDEGWRILSDFGYEAVRQISIDNTWSSVRFRHQSERKVPSKFGATYEGIDRQARTVTPPADLREALEEQNLLSIFDKLAFTHKKEMVVSLLEVKRPETRKSRVQKALELVRKLAAKS